MLMNSLLWTLLIFVSVGIGVWLASFGVEALRSAPNPPKKLRWAPGIKIDYVDARSHKLRFIKSGQGPILVLLHTLRTQLDLFEKVIPELSKHFTVYALDYPGHGYSDIPMLATTPSSLPKRLRVSSRSWTFMTLSSPVSRSAGQSSYSSPHGAIRVSHA